MPVNVHELPMHFPLFTFLSMIIQCSHPFFLFHNQRFVVLGKKMISFGFSSCLSGSKDSRSRSKLDPNLVFRKCLDDKLGAVIGWHFEEIRWSLFCVQERSKYWQYLFNYLFIYLFITVAGKDCIQDFTYAKQALSHSARGILQTNTP
jgi:hypothetical protein